MEPVITDVTKAELRQMICEPLLGDLRSTGEYTSLWRTDDGSVLKLFKGDPDRREDAVHIENDLSTALMLSQRKSEFGSRYVLPSEFLRADGKIIGYIMPYIKGAALSLYIKEIDIDEFCRVMEQFYKDILFVNGIAPFSMCDVHEDNVIVDENGVLFHIDCDGWYNGDGNYRGSRYPYFMRDELEHLPHKYHFDEDGLIVSDLNSDLLCLINIVMNCISRTNGCLYPTCSSDRRHYFDYLRDHNAASFADMCETLFSDGKDNYFEGSAISALSGDISNLSYSSFLKSYSDSDSCKAARGLLKENEKRLNALLPERKGFNYLP